MKKEKGNKHHWRRLLSILLILALAGNEILGNGYVVSAASQEAEMGELLTEDERESESEETESGIQEDELPEETESDFLADDTPQKVLIAQEDVSKRSSNVKYFENEDHSYTAALYPVPVHFEENGEWKAIDNQLTEAEPEENTEFWGNKQNPFRVKFSKKSNGNKLVNIKLEDFQMSWKLKDMQKVDAKQLDLNENKFLPGSYREERQETDEEEAPATIFTEVPPAQDSGLSEAEAEEKWGRKLGNKPENNITEGIMPEQQEKWKDTDEPQEETIDKQYLDKVKQSNEEKMKVKNLSSGVVYEEIYPNVDIEYRLESQKMKENIILKNTEAQNEFIFQFHVNGLKPEQEGQRILFKDGNGQTIFELQQLFLYDAKGECSDKVSLELTQGKGKKCEIKITADPEWLGKEDRVFSVVLDPTVETSQDATAIQDIQRATTITGRF